MNKFTLYAAAALTASATAGVKAQTTTPESQMEKLTRGLVVVPATTGAGHNFVSWRLLGTDNDRTTFDVVRDGTVIKKDLADRTNYVDKTGFSSSKYQIITKQNGTATDTTGVVTPWADFFMQLPLDKPADGNVKGEKYSYSPNDCSVADVDGDGEYEIILKWDPSNSKDNSQSGYTGNVLIDCYKLDGTKLWRIDLGQNIRAGAHYTQFLAYDFDGDGKAELICKTATGSKDSEGNYVNGAATDESIKTADNNKDWRNSSGKVTGGQEYLTVFDGETGKAIHTVFYSPNRAPNSDGTPNTGGAPSWTFNWDDRSGKTDKDYGNRGERYLAAVAYLDGPDRKPSAIMSRGYYTWAYVWAVDFDGKELSTKWLHASTSKTKTVVYRSDGTKSTKTYQKNTSGQNTSKTLYGNGNHNLSIGDVDGDGCDEIIYGSAALDNDGELLYATGYGHGDAIHLGDLVPDHPGLELFEVHEGSPYGWDVHDAATGEILHSATGGGDNGRGCAADIDASNKGAEFWSSNDRQPRSCTTGNTVGKGSTSVNFRVYWDGDLQEELYDDKKIDKWNGTGTNRLVTMYNFAGSSDCNSTKHTPNLQADILGDWREEIILWDNRDGAHLNIFTTNTESSFRVPTLMHDHTYRMAVAWQNAAYNQPPHLGYYLPDQFKTKYVKVTEGEFEQTVSLGDTIADIQRRWANSGNPSLLKSTAPDGTETVGGVMDGFTFTRDLYIDKTFTLKGKPTELGDYKFILKSGKNVVDNSTRNDTIVIHCVDPTGINDAYSAETAGWVSVDDNSFDGRITLSLNLKLASAVSVSLYNTGGAQVFGRTYRANGSTRLTVSGLDNLAGGIYMLKVESAEGTYSKKLIKR